MTTYERLENIENKISELAKGLNPDMQNIEETVDQSDIKFDKRRILFVVVGMIVSALYTYLMFVWFLPLFSISFGFFLAFGMLAFVILFDAYILPGNTLKRISNNAIASSIAILAFVIIIVSGAQIGNSLITDPYKSEEHSQTVNTQYRQPAPASSVSSGMRRDSGTAEREQ